ncbi:hypothetical protein Hanom_Chr04g00308581 [Helianthus anomalus]
MWFALCNAFSPQPTNPNVLACPSYGLNALQSVNHRDHPCTFGKIWGLNALQSANHKDHRCTFRKLGTKSKILVNHKGSSDYPCIYSLKRKVKSKVKLLFLSVSIRRKNNQHDTNHETDAGVAQHENCISKVHKHK